MIYLRPAFRSLAVYLLVALVLPATAPADDSPLPLADYRTESWFLPQSPSVTGGPAAALFNPAAWAMTDRAGGDFWWNDGNVRSGLDNYGFSFGRNLGFLMNTTTHGVSGDSYKIYDYQIGLSGGTRVGAFGLAYRWAQGETQLTPRQKALSLGFISRAWRYTTFGASGVFSLESSAAQGIFDLGLRPFGRDWLTLFADWTANQGQAFFRDGKWGAGLEVRPISGLHLGFRTRQEVAGSDIEYSWYAGLTLHNFNATVLPAYDTHGNNTSTSFLLRTNPPYSGLPVETPLVMKSGQKYYAISLENKVLTYQKYRYFDDKRVAWLDLLKLLDRLRDSERVDGLVINLAGFNGRPSLIWEFRDKLQELQAVGKEIIIHSDRLNQRTYYLASVADHLTMDRWGGVGMPGLNLTRTYLKGTLEKLGIGFQEHRYFKYKSAAETLSRESMSEADREQRQRIVDVVYEMQRLGIAESRSMTLARYDEIVDELGQLTTKEAVEAGLVDAIGRWDQLPRWLKENRGGRIANSDLIQPEREHYDDQWGPTLKIPVVYAVGTCDMDKGIKGRATSAYLRSLIKNKNVPAVVLRADSPGGDPLPSDLVADAVRQLRKAGKPVIISQGDVAASGGYWISMDGTRILTTPMTITGSIGVINGWVWDDGIAEKVGITSDTVTRGQHADLYSMVNLPFVGRLPRRPMNESELERAETLIRGMYDEFVEAVSAGRGLPRQAVGEVAQGRVWMGGDAIEHGLCDEFGTLSDAIALARTEAKVPQWREVEIVEYPRRRLFQMPNLMPGLPGLSGLGSAMEAWLEEALIADSSSFNGNEPEFLLPGLDALDSDYIGRIGQDPGSPLLVIPPELLPEGWKEID